MTVKGENIKKINWKYTAKEVKKIINSHSSSYWVKQTLKYIKDQEDKGKVPTLTGFYKSVGLWIFYLRDDINKGLYKKEEDMLDKYALIQRIIKDGFKEDIINRNAGTATFGIALLQNEEEWDKGHKQQEQGPMSITFVNYNLPDAVPSNELPSPDIIEAEIIVEPSEPITIEPIDYDCLPSLNDDNEDDIPIPVKQEEDDTWDMFAD